MFEFATAVRIGITVTKEWKWVITGIATFLVVLIMLFAAMSSSIQQQNSPIYGTEGISPEVMAWEPVIKAELQKYGLDTLTPILLAIIQQETGGVLSSDIMQASESLGLPPNTISDPLYSIQVGVSYFVNIYNEGKAKGVDLQTIVQSYNFGEGYIDFIAAHGGVHSEDLAKQFSAYEMSLAPGEYTCSASNFRYPYCYGDWSYATKVFSHLSAAQAATGSALGQQKYEALMNEALKYQGWPYAWGGADPSTSFDCSGLVQWCFKTIGYNLPRTAQQQFDATQRITKEELQPGDLIFFETYAPGATHVGIYVGNNRMYDASDSGINYDDLTSYWTSKIVGYGRVN
jgi:hypothetical protein